MVAVIFNSIGMPWVVYTSHPALIMLSPTKHKRWRHYEYPHYTTRDITTQHSTTQYATLYFRWPPLHVYSYYLFWCGAHTSRLPLNATCWRALLTTTTQIMNYNCKCLYLCLRIITRWTGKRSKRIKCVTPRGISAGTIRGRTNLKGNS